MSGVRVTAPRLSMALGNAIALTSSQASKPFRCVKGETYEARCWAPDATNLTVWACSGPPGGANIANNGEGVPFNDLAPLTFTADDDEVVFFTQNNDVLVYLRKFD